MKQVKLDKAECKALFRCIKQEPQHRKRIFMKFCSGAGYAHTYFAADKEDRRLRSVISAMILNNFPIITTTTGYCLATKKNMELLDRARQQANSRAAAETRKYHAYNRIARDVMGQRKLKAFDYYWKEGK